MNINNPLGGLLNNRSSRSKALSDVLQNNSRGMDSPERLLYRAVVMDIDTVGGKFTTARNFPSGDFLNPKNSILAKVFTRNVDTYEDEESYTLCCPLFPQHLGIPLKIGEHVYVIFEDPISKNFALWISRPPEPYQIDDLNFNFSGDRPYSLANEDPESSFVMDVGAKLKSPGDLQKESAANFESSSLAQEAVPAYSRKPHEAVFQGSNNTLIRLGADTQEKESGVIDIVVGRGQADTPGAANVTTSKRPFSKGADIVDRTSASETEGAIDFDSDKARIYVSMNTNADENFGLDGTEPVSVGESATIVKADAVRIVARQSIKIVSENGASSIIMDPDGNIQIGGGAGAKHLVSWEDITGYIDQQIKVAYDAHTHEFKDSLNAVGKTLIPTPTLQSASSVAKVPKIIVD
jgi:hypothetical protein